MLWRFLLLLPGVVGLTAALASTVISLNPAASDTLMAFVFLMLSFEMVIGLAALGYGVRRTVRDWLASRKATETSAAAASAQRRAL